MGQQTGQRQTLQELEEAVLAKIDQDETIAFHQGLVRIPSVNPPGDCREAIAFVEIPLRDAGFEIEHVQDLDIMPNVIAGTGPKDGKTLLVNAHVDVVPIGERDAWTHEPFGAEIADGRVYGRGAGDDKDTALLRFSAGPPYEDIAFRIVDREWECSHRRGFRSSFDRGILQLYCACMLLCRADCSQF